MLLFRPLGDGERAELASARAVSWRGPLSVEEFVRRNQRLYAHPFAQERMRTFGLWDGSRARASLDAVKVKLWVGDGQGQVREQEAWHLASVLTLPEHRGEGAATRLITSYFEAEKPAYTTLFSGIGPSFYEPFGFVGTPAWDYQRPALPRALHDWTALELDAAGFVARQGAARKQALAVRPVPSASFAPDPLWWDWMGSIYQYFGEIRGFEIPKGRFWEVRYPEGIAAVAAVENRASDCLDVWWTGSDSPELLDFLASEAARLGLAKFSWWSSENRPAGHPKRQEPMLRIAASPAGLPLLGTQLGDWW